jgi:hypothetical protein
MVMPVTVADLIRFLQAQPQDLPVAFKLYSEQKLLELKYISQEEACLPRPDGWIQDKRSDKPVQHYLMFPGN